MTDCTARLALADGTVVACQHDECYLPPEEGGGPDCVHEHDGDIGWVGWEDTAPGAYHVVDCKTCRGEGRVPTCRWDDDQHDAYEADGGCDLHSCPTCEGAGWVDPPLPLGIGSVVRSGDPDDYLVVKVKVGIAHLSYLDHPVMLNQVAAGGLPVPVSAINDPRTAWRVIRRVWTAGDDR